MSKRVKGFYLTKMMLPKTKYSIKSPYAMTPEAITIHNTANSATAMQEASYVVNGNGGVSYHYAVDETRAVQILPHNRNGWHAGDGRRGRGNRKTIAIEIARSLSKGNQPFDQAELNGAYLTAALLHQYGWGMDKVKKHQDWSGKYCPHRTLDKGWARFLKLVEHELNLLKSPAPQPTPTPTPAPGPSVSGLKIGDIVNFTGTAHFISSQAASGVSCKPGKAKITAIALNAKHPYHLVGEPGGANVYGWVDTKDITTASAPAKKSIDEIAREVITGKWGNGQVRKNNLKAAGYDPAAVQARVNQLLRK